LNLHPEAALALLKLPEDDPRRSDFVYFFEKMSAEG